MAVGDYIYVGKSRLRRLRKRGLLKPKVKRKGSRNSNSRPSSVSYNSVSQDDESGLVNTEEADTYSTGSSVESEELLPLVSLDPQWLGPDFTWSKMPFEFLKKKKDREDETPVVEADLVDAKEAVEEEVDEEKKKLQEEINKLMQEKKQLQEQVEDLKETGHKEELQETNKAPEAPRKEEDTQSIADSGVGVGDESKETSPEPDLAKAKLGKEDGKLGVGQEATPEAGLCCTIL